MPAARARAAAGLARSVAEDGVLAGSGYVGGAATQAPQVATGVWLLLGGVPVAGAFVCFWCYPLRGRAD
jgi:glycoside/pentoside/hexuronide:cation symporter, GPH family